MGRLIAHLPSAGIQNGRRRAEVPSLHTLRQRGETAADDDIGPRVTDSTAGAGIQRNCLKPGHAKPAANAAFLGDRFVRRAAEDENSRRHPGGAAAKRLDTGCRAAHRAEGGEYLGRHSACGLQCHAKQFLTGSHSGLARRCGGGGLRLYHTGLDRGGQAAGTFDLLKGRPSGIGQIIRP